METILKTAAAAYPVTLAEVKTHLSITASDNDDLLDALIEAATSYTEQITGRALVAQTWTQYMHEFAPGDRPIIIRHPPLISVASIKYYDSADVLQTWSSGLYTVDTKHAYTPRVYPAINESYPSARLYPNAVEIEYIAGYADSAASPVDLADNVPAPLKLAIKLLVGHLFENREASAPGITISSVPFGYDAMIASYRVRRF